MVTRAIGGVERDYLVLEYRGTDRLYLPSDQIDAIRHYTGGDSPSLSKMGGRRGRPSSKAPSRSKRPSISSRPSRKSKPTWSDRNQWIG